MTKRGQYITVKQETSKDFIRIELSAVRVPSIFGDRTKEWIKFGEDNNYPKYLLDLARESAKHNAILKGKVSYICGAGFDVVFNGSVEEKAKINNEVKRSDLSDVINRITYDFEIFNSMCLYVTKSKVGDMPKISHVDVSKIRIGKDLNKLFYSDDWSAYTQSEEKTGFKELPIYDAVKKEGYIYYRHYSPELQAYALPEYIGAVPYIDIDKRIASFHLNNLAHGFSAGTLINFGNGEPTIEEQGVLERKIKKKFTGDEKAGEIILTFSNGQDRAPQVLSLQSNNFDKLFDTLKQTASEEIFTGHNVTSPMLFGVKTEGQLGGRTEIVEAHELFKVLYVRTRQREVESFVNGILDDFDIKYSIKLNEKSAISERLSEQTLTTILTRDELRALAGYKPLGEKENIQLSAQDPILLGLLACGEQEDKFEVLHSRGLVECSQDAVTKEIGFFMSFDGLTKVQQDILGAIQSNAKITITEIAKAVKSDVKVVTNEVQRLFDLGYLKGTIGVDGAITSKGAKDLGNKEIIEVKYRYSLRPNAPSLVQGGKSRPFCVSMSNSRKLYTREEIDSLSMSQGRDVWRYRGGWYTNPNTDVPQPSCRHMWEQVIVKRNG